MWAGLRLLIVMTVILGVAYPAVVWAVGQVAGAQANGSLVTNANGQVVGSALIGQSFDGPGWFQPRPSASDYSGTTSGGSNLAPASAAQAKAVAAREAQLRADNPDATGPIPPDALTASGSGLDPDISLAYAQWQVPRVAKARGMSADALDAMIDKAVDRAALGYIGQDGVNVVTLNLELADASAK